MPTGDINPDFFTPIEAARYVRVHRETLYELIRSGTIKAFKVGGRWRVPQSSLDAYLKKDTIAAGISEDSLGIPDSGGSLQSQAAFLLKPTAAQKRILVADDSQDVRDFFRIVLAKRGHSVVTVPSGREAVERVKSDVYDLIFLDLVMPELDGVETLRQIKAIDPDPTITLITGYPGGELVTKALGMGPFMLMDKPIRVADLLKVVEG